MQILITGAAGFIGFNLARYLLRSSNVKIVGVDNLNNYYSKKLKKDRIKELSRYKKFSFFQINILNKKKLSKVFKKKNKFNNKSSSTSRCTLLIRKTK